AGARRGRAGQLHERHRLHDGARPDLRPDRDHRGRARALRPARAALRLSRPDSAEEGVVMAADDAVSPGASVEDLVRGYGPKGVLNGVTLDIAPGEFVALLGPSGCG